MSGSIAEFSEIALELGLAASITETEQALLQQAIMKAEGAIKRFLKYDPVQAVRTEYYPQQDFSLRGRVGIWEVNDTEAYVEQLSEAVTNELQVRHLPVRALDKDGNNAIDLRIDYDGRFGTRSGSFGNSTQKTEGDDFYPSYDSVDSSGRGVCLDGIIRSEGRWPSTAGSVKITYVAGYTDEELHGQDSVIDASPILDAVIDEVVRRVKKTASREKSTVTGLAGGSFRSEKLGDYSYSIDSAMLDRLIGGTWDLLPETQHKLSDYVNYGILGI